MRLHACEMSPCRCKRSALRRSCARRMSSSARASLMSAQPMSGAVPATPACTHVSAAPCELNFHIYWTGVAPPPVDRVHPVDGPACHCRRRRRRRHSPSPRLRHCTHCHLTARNYLCPQSSVPAIISTRNHLCQQSSLTAQSSLPAVICTRNHLCPQSSVPAIISDRNHLSPRNHLSARAIISARNHLPAIIATLAISSSAVSAPPQLVPALAAAGAAAAVLHARRRFRSPLQPSPLFPHQLCLYVRYVYVNSSASL